MKKETYAQKKAAASSRATADRSTKTDQQASQRNLFLVMALNMSWQLAVVVLVPIIGGVELDKKLATGSVFLFIGLGVAVLGSIAVLWQAVQTANRLPVPKLTDAQKRAIKKSYEEDDD